jgi:hypothetical protein
VHGLSFLQKETKSVTGDTLTFGFSSGRSDEGNHDVRSGGHGFVVDPRWRKFPFLQRGERLVEQSIIAAEFFDADHGTIRIDPQHEDNHALSDRGVRISWIHYFLR